ncbi:hypothetical protein Mapa_006016 [Marchantia paleacea]|nr:hypothetical protein Mapa_006016 [Marchantia paleacea]
MSGGNCSGYSTRFIFFRTMIRAEPKVIAMEEEINKLKEVNKKDAAEIKKLTAILEKTTKSLHEVEEKLKTKVVEVTKMKRCRLCVAGNMTPRSRETYIRKSMLKRYSQLAGVQAAGLLGADGKEKTRAELFQDALAESDQETARGAKIGKDGKLIAGTDQQNPTDGSGGAGGADGEGAAVSGSAGVGSGGGSQIIESGKYKSTTVITFLRAALLKRSQRPTLDEAAKKTVEDDMAAIGLILAPTRVDKEEKETQTDEVTIKEPSEFASVLKRSASCPARMFWIEELTTPEQRERHRSWMEEQGLVPPETGEKNQAEEEKPGEGDDDEVEIVVADRPIRQPEGEEATALAGGEAGEGGIKGEKRTFGQVHKAMKKQVNKLATETLDALGALGEEISQLAGGSGADVAFRMAALISKWKKVAKATGPGRPRSPREGSSDDAGGEGGAGGVGGGAAAGGEGGASGDTSEDFEWEDFDEEGEEGDGRGRRKRRGRGGGRKTSSTGLGEDGSIGAGRSRRSVLGLDRDTGGKSKRSSAKSTSGASFELGKIVPLGFAKMMNINTPPKVVKFFNERQLTKLITSVYVAKIEADAVDDVSENERQSSCEFVYDFMLNLYGLKRLAESAVWGLFKKIKHLQQQKKIDKAHKVGHELLLTQMLSDVF